MKKIDTEVGYNEVMERIDYLMAKGSKNVSEEELADIQNLALAAQQFEQKKYSVEQPSSLSGMIEMKMFEMHLKQKDLAKKLNVSNTKLSLILNGKQKPDINFLKSIYKELKVDAEFILEHA